MLFHDLRQKKHANTHLKKAVDLKIIWRIIMNPALEESKDFLHVLIIGNGFDLAHGLETKYTDFLQYEGTKKNESITNNNILFICFDFLASLKKIEKQFPSGIQFLSPDLRHSNIQKVIEETFQKPNLYNYSRYDDNYQEKLKGVTKQSKQIIEYITEFANNKGQFCTEPYPDSSIIHHESSKENWFNIEQKIYEFIHVSCDKNTSKNLHAFQNYQNKVNELKRNISEIVFDPIYTEKIFNNLRINNSVGYNRFEKHVQQFYSYRQNIDTVYNNLRFFVDAFSKYLSDEVSKEIENLTQNPKFLFRLKGLNNTNFQKYTLWILNFNYTPTFQKLYEKTLTQRGIKVHHCHIHGALGEGNLVLGCQSFDPADKIDPAWNVFTKHHQRHRYGTIDKYQELLKELRHFKGEVAFHILGHSLDQADHAILKHTLCSSHNTAVQDSFISVYYHDEEAHLRLINNITDIIGEEAVMARVRFIDQHDPKRGILRRIHETSKNQ